ncbi:MAG: cellulase family glycosylhydrolase [Bacteroidota bacterium]|nr:cellulase family glycosylhydrolase [Bacteroidota bacterium]
MKKHLRKMKTIRLAILIIGIAISSNLFAELPTAKQIASKMQLGINLGNTLECPYGETGWGAAYTTQRLVDSIKAAGFNTIRIPCAWFTHSDTVKNVIQDAWLSRVREVVNYCIKDSMYVVLNIHWDSGWLENHVTVADSARVNARQKAYWTQIANYFKNYGDHLLFACANEPNNVDKAIGRTVFESYVQTFINAVRGTGGNNTSRTLIFQGDMNYSGIPQDQIQDRLMFEIHNYPYQFALQPEDMLNPWCGGCGQMLYVCYYWGKGNHSLTDLKRNPSYDEEADVDKFYKTLKTRFTDKGVPVILGEYAAWKRGNLVAGADTALHYKSVEYFHYRMVKGALQNGVIPYRWDIPGGLFDRKTGKVSDWGIINAMKLGASEALATAVTSVDKDKDIELYPNPFTTTFTLKLDNLDDVVGIWVYDIMGRQVETIGRFALSNTITLGASLKSGVYIVKVYGENWAKSFKIVKK